MSAVPPATQRSTDVKLADFWSWRQLVSLALQHQCSPQMYIGLNGFNHVPSTSQPGRSQPAGSRHAMVCPAW